MGKGDRKTRKGKIAMGTFGNTRIRKKKSKDRPVAEKQAKPKKTAKKSAK